MHCRKSVRFFIGYNGLLLRSKGNVQALRPQRTSPRGSVQRYKNTLNHHADICRRTRD